MSLRDDVLPIISAGWGIVDDLGFSPYTVKVRTKTWSIAIGNGTATNSDLTISPNPPVKEENAGQSLTVGPIIPSHAGGGYTPQQINPVAYLPATNKTVQVFYVVTGPDGVERGYKATDIDTSDPVEYTLKLIALDRAIPF